MVGDIVGDVVDPAMNGLPAAIGAVVLGQFVQRDHVEIVVGTLLIPCLGKRTG
ncbi:hypothetical protein Q427_21585 [Halomonas sp. BC04]|nr:hypothetical protein Q427_21585 [Halomonas sp. BC04]